MFHYIFIWKVFWGNFRRWVVFLFPPHPPFVPPMFRLWKIKLISKPLKKMFRLWQSSKTNLFEKCFSFVASSVKSIIKLLNVFKATLGNSGFYEIHLTFFENKKTTKPKKNQHLKFHLPSTFPSIVQLWFKK